MDPELLITLLSGGLLSVTYALTGLSRNEFWIRLRTVVEKRQEEVSVEKELRIDSVRRELKRQRSIASSNRRAATLLVLVQVLVGGVLTYSFATPKDGVGVEASVTTAETVGISESVGFVASFLDERTTGLLGLIVLLSTLLNQQFRPREQWIGALRLAADLQTVLDDAEHQLFLMQNDTAQAKEKSEIREWLNAKLAEFRARELDDIARRPSGHG